MSNVLFTADPHFGHANIIKYCNRPFSSSGEMDEVLIERWNSKVGINDTIYVVGDFTMGSNAKDYLKRLNGIKYLIIGNHDRKPSKQDGWAEVYQQYTVRHPIGKFVLFHFAMRVWDQSHRGSYHLYGHSHGTLPDDPTSLSFDVGVDCHNFYPISVEEVVEIMKLKTPIHRVED